MDFINKDLPNGPQFLPAHVEDSPFSRRRGGPYFNRGQPWPSSEGLPDPFWSETEHGRQQYDALNSPWLQHPQRAFERAQKLDEAFLDHTESTVPNHTEPYRADFQHLEPTQDCGYQERRGHGQSSYFSTYQCPPRCGSCREHHDPSFPFDANFGFVHSGENDRRRRACSNGYRTMRDYTVEEPDGSEIHNSSRLPHRTRSRSRCGGYGNRSPELLNWSTIAVAGTEARSRIRTVSTSGSSSHQSPPAAAPPPSPHPNIVHDDQPGLSESQENSPSSTPSRRSSSPRSPCHHEFDTREDAQPPPCGEQVDIRMIINYILGQNLRLNRKRDKLHRLRLDLLRRAEDLNFRELQILEREARGRRMNAGSSRPSVFSY